MQYDSAGNGTLVVSGVGNPASILPLSNGDLLIADFDFANPATGHHQILKYDGANVTTFINFTPSVDPSSTTLGVPQPLSMLFDADGNLLVGSAPDHNLTGTIQKFNVNTGQLMGTIAAGIGTPTGLARSGDKLIVSLYDDTQGKSVLEYQIEPTPVSSVATGDHSLGLAAGLAVAPDGSYYVSNDGTFPGAVLHYSAGGTYLGTLGANDASPNPAPFFVPGALAFGPNGHLYVGDLVDDAVYQYDTTSLTQQFLGADTLALGYAPLALAFTPDASPLLLVGDSDAHTIEQYDGSNAHVGTIANAGNPASILPEKNGDLLIADFDFASPANGHHQVLKESGGVVTTFINLQPSLDPNTVVTGVPQPLALAFDADGNLLVGASPDHNLNGTIQKFDITNGNLMTTLVAGIGSPTGLGFSGGKLLVSLRDDTHGNSVLEYQANPLPLPSSVPNGDQGGGSLFGLTVAPDGSYYVASTGTYPGQVLHYNAAGAYLGTLGASPLLVPGAMAFGPNGHLYVADLVQDAIFQFDTTTNPPQYLPGGDFTLSGAPGGIAFLPTGAHDLLVGNTDLHEIDRYANTGGTGTTYVTGVGNAASILPEKNGDLLIADFDFSSPANGHHQVLKYDGSTVTQFINFSQTVDPNANVTGTPQPLALAYDSDGNLLVGASPDHNLNGVVQEFNIATGALMSTLVEGIGTPSGLGLVPLAANSTVVGRNLFYDNNLAGIDDGVGVDPPNGNPNSQNDDDFAIDPNKVAYLGNGSDEMSTDAQFLSHTSNSNLGINGLMVDLSGTHGTITASDFVFKTGDDFGFNVVPTSSLPSQISVRTGAGNAGSDRIEIVWNTVNSGPGFHASPIINTWLEVELKANADTGLAQGAGLPAGIGDRFFFASLVGDSVDTGNTGTAQVNSNDEIAARNHPGASGDITVIYDYNKDGVVNATDQIIVRNSGHPSLDWIFSSVAFAPQAGGSSSTGDSSSTGGAVASALAGTSTSSSSSSEIPSAIVPLGPLTGGSVAADFNNYGVMAALLSQSQSSNGAAAGRRSMEIERAADGTGVDDLALDAVLADLGLE